MDREKNIISFEKNSFPPIINNSSRILILGSMPGEESLRNNQYYGHPRNQFWPIMFDLFEVSHSLTYSEKTRLIQSRNIALWDVLKRCERRGSLDSDIKNEEPNDFKTLLSEYPGIRHICFNGKKAYNSFKKMMKEESFFPKIDLHPFPSTSPAYTLSFEKKFDAWRQILELL